MLQVAVGGYGGYDSRFTQWGWVFSTGSEPKDKSKSTPVVDITLQQCSSPDEICGTVQQLFRDKNHCGLLVEFTGTIQMQNSAPTSLLGSTNTPTLIKSSVYQLLSGSPDGDVVVTTKAFQKFPFKLAFPEAPIPPSFQSALGSVQYRISVFMLVNKTRKLLGEKWIYYFGQLTLARSGIKPEIVFSCEISCGNLIAILEIPKKEFLPCEEIPFTIKFNDPDKGLVKKLSVIWVRKIIFTSRKEEKLDTQILDVVTFKRFLKRERFSRSGKFKGKIMTVSYYGNADIQVQVMYAIQLKVTTTDKQTVEQEMEVVIGTKVATPDPSAPRDDMHPMEGSEAPSAPMRRMSLASSLLSLLPPAYSNLPSRAPSTLSLETLPPHYDDISPI